MISEEIDQKEKKKRQRSSKHVAAVSLSFATEQIDDGEGDHHRHHQP